MISEREWQETKWCYKNRIKNPFHFIESVEVMEGLSLYLFVQKLTIVSVMLDSFVFSNTHNRWPPNISSTGHKRHTANKSREGWKIGQSRARTLIKCHQCIDNLLWMPHTIWFSVLNQLTFTFNINVILQYKLWFYPRFFVYLYFSVRNLDFESRRVKWPFLTLTLVIDRL